MKTCLAAASESNSAKRPNTKQEIVNIFLQSGVSDAVFCSDDLRYTLKPKMGLFWIHTDNQAVTKSVFSR